jgi:hypothetical protein
MPEMLETTLIASIAAISAIVYWPRLNRDRHPTLPEATSWITEPMPCAISAGPMPPARSSAIEKAVESVSISSLPRRGIFTGSISPRSTPAVNDANVIGCSTM